MRTLEPGAFIALVAGLVIAIAAIALTALVEGRRPRRDRFGRHDANASQRDGKAAATWVGVREASHHDGNHGGHHAD